MKAVQSNLPLRSETPDVWAEQVLRDPLALLNDHAYLERKAALNAMELLHRWPERAENREWVLALARISRDEALHLNAVTKHLFARGGTFTRGHHNAYAADLRKLVRQGQGNKELLDRLLVSALIEARSCERFAVLARESRDRELAKFYNSLCVSEMGHYKVFLKLGRTVRPKDEVSSRWEKFLDAEAAILAKQPPGPRMHSGIDA